MSSALDKAQRAVKIRTAVEETEWGCAFQNVVHAKFNQDSILCLLLQTPSPSSTHVSNAWATAVWMAAQGYLSITDFDGSEVPSDLCPLPRYRAILNKHSLPARTSPSAGKLPSLEFPAARV